MSDLGEHPSALHVLSAADESLATAAVSFPDQRDKGWKPADILVRALCASTDPIMSQLVGDVDKLPKLAKK
jgi:hypothetical protein